MINSQKELNELIVNPADNYNGKSYKDYVKEFIQWLVSHDPDNQSLNDVVNIRGVDFHKDPSTYSSYSHSFVKIGKDALTMTERQGLFITVQTSFADEIHHHLETPEKRKYYVNQLIQMGDDPPFNNQISIDGFHPEGDMLKYKVITDDFLLRVPEPVDGKTLGQLLDVPFNQPGDTWTVAGGYFLLLANLPVGNHVIGFYGNGDFGYSNRALVEVNVVPSNTLINKPTMNKGEIQGLQYIVDSKILAEEIQDGEKFYKVLRSLGEAEKGIDKIKTKIADQIKAFDRLDKEQKEWMSGSESRLKNKQIQEHYKLRKAIAGLGKKAIEDLGIKGVELEEQDNTEGKK